MASLALAGASQATVGTVDMRWDDCAGPVDKTTSAAGVHRLFLSEIGQDQAHVGYVVQVLYGNASQQVPDAWRFDTTGCQGPRIVQDFSAKNCPPFHQDSGDLRQFSRVDFSPVFDAYATTLMRIVFANAYDTVSTVDPGTRYLLDRITFDLGLAVPGEGSPGTTCGGFEQPMCFKLSYATVVRPEILEEPFNRPYTLAVTFNGPGACAGTVPASPRTWGSIRSQYRE